MLEGRYTISRADRPVAPVFFKNHKSWEEYPEARAALWLVLAQYPSKGQFKYIRNGEPLQLQVCTLPIRAAPKNAPPNSEQQQATSRLSYEKVSHEHSFHFIPRRHGLSNLRSKTNSTVWRAHQQTVKSFQRECGGLRAALLCGDVEEGALLAHGVCFAQVEVWTQLIWRGTLSDLSSVAVLAGNHQVRSRRDLAWLTSTSRFATTIYLTNRLAQTGSVAL